MAVAATARREEYERASGQDRVMKPGCSSLRSNGARSRPLLLMERTMYREGRTPFIAVFTVKIAGALDEKRLRDALARVQARHPLLRCVVEEAEGGPRFVLLDRHAPIPLRIVERQSDDDWQCEARREWVTPFDASREPLARLVWLRADDANELMLVAHHCICDGYSGINLVRECLRACDEPQTDPGGDTLGGIEDIVPAALLENRRFRRRVRWKSRILRLTLFLKQRGGSKPRGPRIPFEQIYFYRWDMGLAVAQMFTESCRREGVTVLAAVSVAFMQAFRDVRGTQGVGKIRVMVNARRFLPEMRADALFGLAPGVALCTSSLPPRDMAAGSFWARARAVRAELTRRVDRLGSGLRENLVALEGLHDKYPSLVAFFEKEPAVRSLTLSNLGRLDLPQEYRTFRLERVYSPLVMVSPTPANTLVISSFGGQMEFAIISDEQSLPRSQAIEIRQRAMEILSACAALRAPSESTARGQQSAMRPEMT